MNKLQKRLHQEEIKGRKVTQKHRKGNYYMNITNKSANGVEYTNLVSMDTFGRLSLDGFNNEPWEYLVRKAKENISKGK
jgi:hypothetical protein